MMNRLSHSRLGNISFIALVTLSYVVPRSRRSLVTKCDIVPRAIKQISPGPSCDNLYIHKIIFRRNIKVLRGSLEAKSFKRDHHVFISYRTY